MQISVPANEGAMWEFVERKKEFVEKKKKVVVLAHSDNYELVLSLEANSSETLSD